VGREPLKILEERGYHMKGYIIYQKCNILSPVKTKFRVLGAEVKPLTFCIPFGCSTIDLYVQETHGVKPYITKFYCDKLLNAYCLD